LDKADLDKVDLDDQALEVDCDMAQAFEIPGKTGERQTTVPRSPELNRGTSSNAFQIAAPGPTQRLDRH
jgi:hypothetical protein